MIESVLFADWPAFRPLGAARRRAELPCLVALAFAIGLSGGCKPPPPAATATPAAASQAASVPPAASDPQASPAPPAAAAPAKVNPDDPLEQSRQLVEAHAEVIRLLSTVKDLETAKAVAGKYPAASERHRLLEEKLRNRLLTREVRLEVNRQFKKRREQLQEQWKKEHARVAFIPGALEHMDPELTPFADLTVMPDDVDGLEREILRLRARAINLLRQTTDLESAVELSANFRAVVCRLPDIHRRMFELRSRLGMVGVELPRVALQMREYEAELRRLGLTPGVFDALRYGKAPTSTPLVSEFTSEAHRAECDRIIENLLAADKQQVTSALAELRETTPDIARERVGNLLFLHLQSHNYSSDAAEAFKRGWFSPTQMGQMSEAVVYQRDREVAFKLAEGISRVPILNREAIDFLASLLDENPAAAAVALRNVGAAAESIVQTYAASPKAEVRLTVCELLGDIGTEVSLPTLQKLTSDSDRQLAAKAHEAIGKIGQLKGETGQK
ncbi:MAG TPA: HEAT repeat domain-containing protein [Pirellulaceae bacterium]|nr:HEAT repeat domain-containing protein [Pirellulaceae bacterium]